MLRSEPRKAVTIAELKKLVSENTNGSTHYAGCEAVHGWCAAAVALAHLEIVEGQLLDLRMSLAAKRKGAAITLKFPGVS